MVQHCLRVPEAARKNLVELHARLCLRGCFSPRGSQKALECVGAVENSTLTHGRPGLREIRCCERRMRDWQVDMRMNRMLLSVKPCGMHRVSIFR